MRDNIYRFKTSCPKQVHRYCITVLSVLQLQNRQHKAYFQFHLPRGRIQPRNTCDLLSYQPPKLLRKMYTKFSSVSWYRVLAENRFTCEVTVPAHFTQPTRAFMRRYRYRFSTIKPNTILRSKYRVRFYSTKSVPVPAHKCACRLRKVRRYGNFTRKSVLSQYSVPGNGTKFSIHFSQKFWGLVTQQIARVPGLNSPTWQVKLKVCFVLSVLQLQYRQHSNTVSVYLFGTGCFKTIYIIAHSSSTAQNY